MLSSVSWVVLSGLSNSSQAVHGFFLSIFFIAILSLISSFYSPVLALQDIVGRYCLESDFIWCAVGCAATALISITAQDVLRAGGDHLGCQVPVRDTRRI